MTVKGFMYIETDRHAFGFLVFDVQPTLQVIPRRIVLKILNTTLKKKAKRTEAKKPRHVKKNNTSSKVKQGPLKI